MTNLQIQIKPDDQLTSIQRRGLDDLLKEAFKDDVDPGYEWAQPTIHVLAYAGGRLASYAGILEREILVGDRKILVAGITDVATDVHFRGQGCAHTIMKAAGEFVREQDRCQFVMIFCNEELVPLYESCGYRTVKAPLFIHSGGKRFQIDEIKMVLVFDKEKGVKGKDMADEKDSPLGKNATFVATTERWPEGEIDLVGLPW